MYRKNQRHLQPALISTVRDLPDKQRQRLEASWAGVFYREFFCRLKEEPFAVLYADCPSRPNIPVNVLVSLETLKAGHGWSDEELHDAFTYNVQVRYALGYHQLGEGDFELRTLYNFRQRLSQYNQKHGLNLLTRAFEDITAQQIVAFKVRTGLQRMDSTQIASNILDASRLQLLVECLQRVQRMLAVSDQERYGPLLAPYVQGRTGQYVYRLKGPEANERHLREIGRVMHTLLTELSSAYADQPVFAVLQRLFAENFQVLSEGLQPKERQALSADSLQALDDLEASFRRRGSREYKGYVANLSETCEPENELQLITGVQVAPNTTDDAALLVEALPALQQRAPLTTLYTDGGYGSPAADEALAQQHVEQVQTGLRGHAPDPQRFSLADFELAQDPDGQPLQITCPQRQTVPVQRGRSTGYLARFDPAGCTACPFVHSRCRARPGRRDPRFQLNFTWQQMNWARRRRRSRERQQEEKNLRVAVEATMRALKHPFRAGKLPVRGRFRVTSMMVTSAAMVNVRRVHQYLVNKEAEITTPTEPDRRETPSAFSFLLSLRDHLSAWLRQLAFRPSCFSC